MADAPTRGIVRTRLPYTGITAVDAGFTIIAQQVSQVATEIETLTETVEEGGTPSAPTNQPTPTGIGVAINSDGSMDVTLTWNYSDGDVPADFIVLFWKQGTAALATPTADDKALLLAPTARVFVFQGWNPNSNYRFGIAAGAKTAAGSAVMVGAILSPTSAPDWADVSATGDYTARVSGVPAATVTANAANGQTAFSGTVQYRTTGAPDCTIVPASMFVTPRNDGSIAFFFQWFYSDGARIADGILVFWNSSGGVPTLSSVHFDMGKPTVNAFALEGLTQDAVVSFGVAAYRKTENGTEVSAIVTSTAAPDWQDLSVGTPNYAGTIFSKEQHNFDCASAGQNATDTITYILRDGTALYGPVPTPRSYVVLIYDMSTKTVVASQVCDSFLSAAAWMNVGLLATLYLTANRVFILLGGHEPQANRLSTNVYVRQVCTGSAFGLNQACAVTPGQTYTVSMWVRNTRFVSGYLRVGFNGTGFDYPTTVGASGGIWVLSWITGTIPAGQTTAFPYFYTDSSPNGDWEIDDVRFELGTAIGGAANLVGNGSFDNGFTGWTAFGTPGAGESRTIFNAGQYSLDILKQHGLDLAKFVSDSIKFGSALIFVGGYQIGLGNGLHVFSGTKDNDPLAMCRLSFQTQNTQIMGLSGNSWTPEVMPGVATNNPVPSAASVFARASGAEVHLITWTYTQPALTDGALQADGFVVYGNGIDAPVTLANAAFAEKVDVNARFFTHEAPFGQQWSYAIATFRKTKSGEQVGPLVNSASAPDWQGVGGTTQVSTPGIADDAVSTPKVQNLAVTTAKIDNLAVTNAKINDLSAQKITTGLLTVNPVSAGATGIFVDNAGKIRLKAMSSTPSKISFENGSGVEQAAIFGNASGNFNVQSDNTLQLYGTTRVLVSHGFSGGFIDLTGGTVKVDGSTVTLSAAGGSIVINSPNTQLQGETAVQSPWFPLVAGSLGSFVGYFTVKNTLGAGTFKVPVYNL